MFEHIISRSDLVGFDQPGPAADLRNVLYILQAIERRYDAEDDLDPAPGNANHIEIKLVEAVTLLTKLIYYLHQSDITRL